MFAHSVELYDALYGTIKDYGAEAASLAELIRARLPAARTVLDVACGTGEHAKHLTERGFAVDGIDLEPGFVRAAAAKVPRGRFRHADMTAFALDTQYDVVACLFSSIGYVAGLPALGAALRCFRAHTRPGGLVLVEPWFEPDQWRPGHVAQLSARVGDTLICRVSRAAVSGSTSLIDFHYLIASPAGIEHRTELHRLQLFTQAEMRAAFSAAGMAAELQLPGLDGRGLYVASVPAGAAGDLTAELGA